MIVIDLHDLKVRDVDEREAFAMQLRGTHQLIHTSAEYSYLYARDILKGRFTPGEAAIAGDAQYSYRYAIAFNLKLVGGVFQPC